MSDPKVAGIEKGAHHATHHGHHQRHHRLDRNGSNPGRFAARASKATEVTGTDDGTYMGSAVFMFL